MIGYSCLYQTFIQDCGWFGCNSEIHFYFKCCNVTVQKKDWKCVSFDFLNRFYCHLSGQNFQKKVPFKCAMISPSHHLPSPAVLKCLNVTLEYSRKSITKLSILPPCSYLTLSVAPAPVLGAICRMNGCPVKRWNLNVALEMDVK